jgi:hypothetical protein
MNVMSHSEQYFVLSYELTECYWTHLLSTEAGRRR